MGVRPNFAEDVYGEKAEKNTEFSESSLASRRSANLPKLKNVRDVHADVIISTHYDSSDAEKDLKFNYTDCDTLLNEFAELYTYSEMDEFAVNIALWKTVASKNTQIDSPYYFNPLPKSVKITVIRDLQSRMESAEQNVRLNAARVVLYLLQGSVLDFVEVPLLDRNIENVKQDNGNSGYEEECVMQSVRNAYLCSEYGIFQSLCTLLVVEMDEKFDQSPDEGRPCSKASSRDSRSVSNADLYSARSKKAATLADNESLRVIMSCLYHMVEGIRNLEMAESLQSEIPNVMKLRSDFLKLMEEPVETVNLPLLYILFNMLKPFYLSESPHYPIRKIVLLLWKILLATLGGWDQLRVMKEEKRKKLNLPIMEDTLSVAASLPSMPIQESDLALLASRRAGNAARAGMMARQFACNDDPTLSDDERDSAFDDWKSDSSSSSSTSEPQTPTPDAPEPENRHPASQTSGDRTPRVGTPVKLEPPKKQLVWKSKISQSGIEEFVQNGRIRHLDFKFAEKDATTLLGMPPSFAKSVDLLKKNLYTSVSEIQKEKDEDYNRYLFSMKEEIEQTKAEILYQEVLPNLGDYLVGLMKVLLAAVPSNKAKSDALNILIDVLTPETEGSDILSNSISLDHSASPLEDSVKLAIDINRHKEVLVKAASAALLLLTKHFKLNHIYQFEFVCQQVVYGNGIPLLLKHLDQDLVRFVQSRYEIHAYNYPQCLLHYVRNGDEWPSLNAENVEEARCGEYFMWRNVFSVINIIRFLNKVVKGHQSRVMMLIAYKSAPVLKRSLKIRLPLFQFYVLKAIKMQSRYLGRQWRKSNMDVISAIYSRVRHRIMDDWAFANVVRRQCDYQVEESQLKFAVERFHNRRYSKFHHQYAIEVDDRPMPGDNYLNRVDLRDFKPCEKSMAEVLNVHAELSDEFKKNYEAWMDREVIRSKINWDEFLSPNADEII